MRPAKSFPNQAAERVNLRGRRLGLARANQFGSGPLVGFRRHVSAKDQSSLKRLTDSRIDENGLSAGGQPHVRQLNLAVQTGTRFECGESGGELTRDRPDDVDGITASADEEFPADGTHPVSAANDEFTAVLIDKVGSDHEGIVESP